MGKNMKKSSNEEELLLAMIKNMKVAELTDGIPPFRKPPQTYIYITLALFLMTIIAIFPAVTTKRMILSNEDVISSSPPEVSLIINHFQVLIAVMIVSMVVACLSLAILYFSVEDDDNINTFILHQPQGMTMRNIELDT